MIGVSLDAEKALSALNGLSTDLKGRAVSGIVREVAVGTFKKAFENLSGDHAAPPGSWPVPVRSGNLRRELWVLFPGEKNARYGAGFDEAYIGDGAEYSDEIHKGRPFLYSALEDMISRAPNMARDFMDKEVRLRGLD